MRIALLAPIEISAKSKEHFLAIANYLTDAGHTVIQSFSVSVETLYSWNETRRTAFFNTFYANIAKSDIVIAECTYPSVHVGFEISHAIQQGKEIIMLKSKNAPPDVMTSDQLNLNKNIYIYEYTKETLFRIIQEALECNPIKKYQKYNVLFPTEMVNKLNQISKKKNLPKSVYIRQLLEEGLAMEILE